MNDFVSAADFFRSLREDERVYFLVRHGERAHIMRDDPHHGEFVGLTEHGREQALNLGRIIASSVCCANGCIAGAQPCIELLSFFSSPVGRCVQTAENIGRGFYEVYDSKKSDEGRKLLAVTPLQPLAEFFVEHYEAYMETHRTGFYQGICRWLDGTARDPDYVDPAYYPLASRSEEMLRLMLSKGSKRINIFATHDAWIVPCLTHFCGIQFSPQRWMNFLTGMAVVSDAHAAPDGAFNAGNASARDAIRRIVPVTALDTGWMLF